MLYSCPILSRWLAVALRTSQQGAQGGIQKNLQTVRTTEWRLRKAPTLFKMFKPGEALLEFTKT